MKDLEQSIELFSSFIAKTLDSKLILDKLKEKDEQIEELERSVKELKEENRNISRLSAYKDFEISEYKVEKEEYLKELDELKDMIVEYQAGCCQDKLEINSLKNEIISKDNEIEDYKRAYQKLKDELNSLKAYNTAKETYSDLTVDVYAKTRAFKDLGRNKIYQTLRNLGILDKRNIPKQKYVDYGLFKIGVVDVMKGSFKSAETYLIITHKGADFLDNLFKEKE